MWLGRKSIGTAMEVTNMAMTKVWRKICAAPGKFLWRAPRAFVLKKTRNSTARFGKEILGKSVALVGNAQSLLATDYGAKIDNHDFVIRLNKGAPAVERAQGTRTDAVGITPELTEAEIVEMFGPKLFLFLIPKMRHFKFYGRENVSCTLFYPFRCWLADRNLIGRRPSSGFMAASWLINLGTSDSITLYGFDFGQSGTYYNPKDYKTPHNFDREGEIIQDWEAQGLLRIVRAD